MQPIDKLLPRLEKVRAAGKNKWRACCPAHGGRHQNLSVAVGDDGETLLMRCFSHGCGAAEIVAAVGLELTDLFPEKLTGDDHRKPQRAAFSAADALRCLAFEGLLLAAAGRAMLNGSWNEREQGRLTIAVGRINAALDSVGVRP